MRVWFVLLAIGLGCVANGFATEGQKRKPNIIVIVGDDMGYADIGVHGCQDIPTPHIDALAQSGVRCTNGYVSGPYCSPTRAGLMTGKYQTRFGHEFNPGPANQFGLSLSETTLANRLDQLGYATALVGKWHLGGTPDFAPPQRGFHEFFGFLGGAHPYFPGQGGAILRGTTAAAEREYLTDAFGREAVSFVEEHAQQPFFLYLSFNAVHMPLQASEKYRQRFAGIPDERRRTYAAMMSAMDDAIGALMAKVTELGLDEDTLVFFFSDNGGPPANASRNSPLRGGKATTWEGGVRVPFLVQWKGMIDPGTIYDQPVIQLDIVPTALVAAGGTVPSEDLDGVDLMPYLRGQESQAPHEALFWRFGDQLAVRQGDWKLVKARGSEGTELFNLREDIGESQNLAAAEPERVRELQAAWDTWNIRNVPPAWQARQARRRVREAGDGRPVPRTRRNRRARDR